MGAKTGKNVGMWVGRQLSVCASRQLSVYRRLGVALVSAAMTWLVRCASARACVQRVPVCCAYLCRASATLCVRGLERGHKYVGAPICVCMGIVAINMRLWAMRQCGTWRQGQGH